MLGLQRLGVTSLLQPHPERVQLHLSRPTHKALRDLSRPKHGKPPPSRRHQPRVSSRALL
ncbi:hypothetical protein B0H17DRAFT_1074792, partial [Mycena rosella]